MRLLTTLLNLVLMKQRRRLCAVFIAMTLITLNFGVTSTSAGPVPTGATVVLDTASATPLPGSFQVVRAQQGNETNPHVDCDVASFTYDDFQGSSTIHYHDLTTGTDNVVPGNQVDLLSDISGSRVAYTEVTFSGDTVRIFDTNSLATTIVPGFGMSNPSIGGNLVAYEDRSSVVPYSREIDTYDLSTGIVTKLTNGDLENFNPDVSANGAAVIWTQCTNTQVTCDVYSAVRTAPGIFTTRQLTTGLHETSYETSTSGELAVYVSNRTGERDVYYQPVTGGTEVHLAIPGDQRWPNISGDLISFESRDANGYDIFVYDTRTAKLYQVTNGLPFEELSEISVCGDTGRIVYVDAGDAFDAFAFTFQVPSVPNNTQDQLDDLITLVRSFNLPAGTANSLIRKLQNAIDAVNASDNATACSLLTAFINECQAQSGKKLTPAQSTQVINSANQIKTSIGCP